MFISVKNLRSLTALLAVVCLSAIGCGSNHRDSLSETQQVNATVAALGDAAMSEESFASVFASGAAPDGREEYATCIYEVIGSPSISNEEATAEVQVTTGFANGNQDGRGSSKTTERETRQVTWTLSKEGTEWKIKDAPLQ